MSMRAVARPLPAPWRGWLFFPLLFALLLLVPGCSQVMGEPASELPLAMPVHRGTVMQVNTADSVEKKARSGDIAITVNLDDGRSLIVVQPEDNIYTPGDRVRVVRSGKEFVRVQILTPAP